MTVLPAGAGACAQQHFSQVVVKATANSQNFILAVLALPSPEAKTGTAVPLYPLPASWKMTLWNFDKVQIWLSCMATLTAANCCSISPCVDSSSPGGR